MTAPRPAMASLRHLAGVRLAVLAVLTTAALTALAVLAVAALILTACGPATPPTIFGPPCPYGQHLVQTPSGWPTCTRSAR